MVGQALTGNRWNGQNQRPARKKGRKSIKASISISTQLSFLSHIYNTAQTFPWSAQDATEKHHRKSGRCQYIVFFHTRRPWQYWIILKFFQYFSGEDQFPDTRHAENIVNRILAVWESSVCFSIHWKAALRFNRNKWPRRYLARSITWICNLYM